MATPRLVLRLLGGFEARIDTGRGCPIPTRKGQALLGYLALADGRAVPRDVLAALLWPDSPDEQARASLRHALAVIRQALGPTAARCLVTDADTVALDPPCVDVDVTAFERSLRQETVPELEAAIALYGGDLLAGLRIDERPFEEWLRHERARLRELAVDAGARLLEACRRSGSAEAAIQAGLRLLALDPVQEPVHRALMELYVQLGRRGAALRQYQTCVEVLRDDLGIDPEPATRRLHQTLLTSRDAAGGPPNCADDADDPVPAAPRPTAAVRWEHRYVTLLQATLSRPADEASATRLSALAMTVRDFGGIVEEIQPSGVVAVFGGGGDDEAPTRAARAALAMAQSVNQEMTAAACPVAVRGAVVVRLALTARGSDGIRLELESKQHALMALADLLPLADAGSFVCDRDTVRFLTRRVRTVSLDTAKGRAAAAYRIAGLAATTDAIAGTPFVGREEELNALGRALPLSDDGAKCIALVGEAGIGKSRLLAEFRSRTDDRQVTWLAAPALPSAVGEPYGAIAAMVRRACGIDAETDAETSARALGATLDELGLDRDRLEAPLCHLLRSGGTGFIEALSPQQLREAMYDAVCTLLARRVYDRETVLVFEDVHWLDDASRQLLSVLVQRLVVAPMLLVFTARPQSAMPWLDPRRTVRIALRPLARSESLRLLRFVLGDVAVTDAVAERIVARAGGNPLFLEELGRQRREAAAGDSAEPLPGTIRELLQTRIDQLDPESRNLLDVAAVLGPEFPAALWEAAAEPDRPEPGVATLEELDLVRPTGSGRAFEFAHALVHETAYGMLDDLRRRSLHLRAARAIERLHGSRLDDLLDRLAYHYARSGDVERAVEHLTRFASQAARMKARAESVAALAEALTCIEQLAEGVEQDRLFLRFVQQQRDALREMGDLQVGKLQLLLRQRARVDASDDREAKRAFHLWLGRVATTCGEFEMGIECAGHAARIAVEEGDRITEGAALATLAHAHGWLGHGRYALACGHRALSVLEDAGDPFWLGYALRGLTWAHHVCAQHSEASATASRLAAVAVEAEVPFYVFSAIWMGAMADLYLGRDEHAVAEFRRARNAATTRLWLAQASAFLGVAHIERGEGAAAISVLTPLVTAGERLRQPHVQAYFTARLGEAHLLVGDAARARELGLRARALAQTSRFRLAYAHATRTVGRAAHATGDADEAARRLGEAVAIFAGIPAVYEAERTRNDPAFVRG